MADWSRRALLTAGTAAGAVGISGLATGTAHAAPSRTVALRGFNMQLLGKRGSMAVGDTLTVRGQLQQTPGGPAVGEVFITGAVLASADQDATVANSFEQHLFVLGGDTITGSGIVRENGAGAFTVTGGSGQFADIRGTYTSRQSADASGEGATDFSFLLLK
jgi:hypothetical protein